MNVRFISRFRQFAQRVRHWPALGFLNPVWALLRWPYQRILNLVGSATGIEVPVGGDWMRLHPDFATQRWEQTELVAYRAFVEALQQDSVVFDIGSHLGTYALLAAARIRPPGRVIAYEPHADSREYLRQHLRWNPGGDQVTVRDACCGSLPGRADFYCVPGKAEGTNGLVPVEGFARQSVEVTTVDADARRFGCAPTLIKIDVEGAEFDVLKGAVEVLGRDRPVLLLSLHPPALSKQGLSDDEIIAWLRARDYDCQVISQDHEVHVVARPVVRSVIQS